MVVAAAGLVILGITAWALMSQAAQFLKIWNIL